jgi:hypothetical protein
MISKLKEIYMTARDRWEVQFKCPTCGKVGAADLSQADGWSFMKDQSTSVDDYTKGFDFRIVENRIKFFCIADQTDTVKV